MKKGFCFAQLEQPTAVLKLKHSKQCKQRSYSANDINAYSAQVSANVSAEVRTEHQYHFAPSETLIYELPRLLPSFTYTVYQTITYRKIHSDLVQLLSFLW